MCRLKQYTERMDEQNTSVSFRFDFYSMPSFRNTFVENAKYALSARRFTERILTEEEKQMINIDSVCNVLGNSIEEIIGKKVYKLEGIACRNRGEIDLYVSPYFLYVHCSRELNKELPWDDLYNVFKLLAQFGRDIDLQNTTCSVIFRSQTDEDGLWSVFDRSAFPTLDKETMTVGRYADSHKYDDMTVELVRIVRIGRNQQPNGRIIDPCYFVNITSVGNLRDERLLDKKDVCNDRIKVLYTKTRDEATKCFYE